MASAAAVPVTAATAAIQNHPKVQESTEVLKKRLTEAEKNIGQLEINQKKVIKSGLIIVGLLAGIDLSLLL